MFDGFVKVAAATPYLKVADCGFNAKEIISLIDEAAGRGVKILVFPELCVTSYTCQDLFFQSVLIDGALTALREIVAVSEGHDMLVTVGCPLRFGGALYNCAVVFKDGRVLGVVPKKFLPNYNEFYEARQYPIKSVPN